MTANTDVLVLAEQPAIVLSPADEHWVVEPPRGAWKAKVQRFAHALRDPAVYIPGSVLLFIILACFFGPLVFSAPSPNTGNLSQPDLPLFSPGHLLGTNGFGNDTLSRVLHGGQVSLAVGIGATAIGLVIGSILGMSAGYFGGLIEATIMRILDTLLSFPSLILALAIADFLGPNEFHTILAVSFYGIVVYARLARSQTIRVRHRDFVVAARSSGVRPKKIIFGHILPNVMPPLLAYAMITVGVAMLVEAALSYLGLGIRPPQPSWGNMIFAGVASMTSDPALVLIPCLFLLVTVMSLNLTADALRRRLAFDR
ncbi:MAG TPA: ABC transporter permease [Acidimicrobiales bacterium]